MANLSALAPQTILSLATEIDANGDAAKIAETLTKMNAILLDAPWEEADGIFSMTVTQRLSLPSGTHRAINEGVPVESTHTRQLSESMAEILTYNEMDKSLIDAHPNPELKRSNEANAFIEGISQTQAAKMFYGNTQTAPKEPTGLAPRLDDSDQTNVHLNESNGGTVYSGSTNTSIYAVQWGEEQVTMFYPRGQRKNLGIIREDKGVVTVTKATTGLASTKQHEAYRELYQLKYGMAVHDERCIARLANIRAMHREATYNANWKQLVEMLAEMKNGGVGAVLYVPKVIYSQLRIMAAEKTNVYWDGTNPWGKKVLYFDEHPVRLCEAILKSESTVS